MLLWNVSSASHSCSTSSARAGRSRFLYSLNFIYRQSLILYGFTINMQSYEKISKEAATLMTLKSLKPLKKRRTENVRRFMAFLRMLNLHQRRYRSDALQPSASGQPFEFDQKNELLDADFILPAVAFDGHAFERAGYALGSASGRPARRRAALSRTCRPSERRRQCR